MPERRIATVLMLDVVGSTQVAAQLGDARYRELSSRFNRMVRGALKRHRGQGGGPRRRRVLRHLRPARPSDQVRRSPCRGRPGARDRDPMRDPHRADPGPGRQDPRDRRGDRRPGDVARGRRRDPGHEHHEGAGNRLGLRVRGFLGPRAEGRARDLAGLRRDVGGRRGAGAAAPGGRGRRAPGGHTAVRRAGAAAPRTKVLVAGALALLVTIAAVAFAATRGDIPERGRQAPPSGSVVQLDPETGDTRTIFVGQISDLATEGRASAPDHGVAVGQGGVWVLRKGVLFHVDPLRGEVRRRIAIGGYFGFSTNVASGSDAVWVVTERALFRVHPATGEPTLLERTIIEPPAIVSADVAVGEGYVWVGTADGRLLRLEPRTGERRWRSGLGRSKASRSDTAPSGRSMRSRAA